MKKYSIQDVADFINAEAVGNISILISAVQSPSKAGAEDLALAMDKSYKDELESCSARAAILWEGADWEALGFEAAIFVRRSRYALSGVSYLFESKPEIELGIHPTALIDESAQIGEGCAIGPFVVIGRDVKIGKNARILSHCSISEAAKIGDDALLYQGVRIGARVEIGNGFISQAGTVIGVDGFSYVTPEKGAVEEARETGQISAGTHSAGFARINSLGTVLIGDNVECGANCSIDRGTIENTCIGNGTKLDNLVHIGHNVMIGETCLICGQVGIAGSSVIGDRVVLGGQVGVADHINIGSDVIAAGKSGISSHVPSGRIMMGSPAMKMDLNVESYKALRRLPRFLRKIVELEKLVSKNPEIK